MRGVVTRGHFPAVTFPRPAAGLAQVFWGETAGCICQGLRDVFEFLGGVPLRAVFDNATEVGRRVGAEIGTSALFRRFAAHYGLDHGFTNPCPGNEKGSAGNEVGALRRNLFVPVPQVWDARAYNGRLLGTCPGLSDGKPRYRRGIPDSRLFEADRAAPSPPPGRSRATRPSSTASRSTSRGTTGHSSCWRGVPPVPRIPDAEREGFSSRARSLFISRATISWFLETATPGRLVACSGMLARELESRERSKRARLLRQARFPVPKAVEGFDWSNVRFPEGWGRDEMLSPGFVGRAEDLVFHGPTGRGKTHVATALGIEATRRGMPVRFFQTATLVLRLGKAKREGALDRLLADVGRAGLVILDGFGYVPFDVDGARPPCQAISDSYERRGIVLAANVEFSRGGTVFADGRLAAAIVDRVVHHGRLVEFGGPSHRLEESLMLGKSGSSGRAGAGNRKTCVPKPERRARPFPQARLYLAQGRWRRSGSADAHETAGRAGVRPCSPSSRALNIVFCAAHAGLSPMSRSPDANNLLVRNRKRGDRPCSPGFPLHPILLSDLFVSWFI